MILVRHTGADEIFGMQALLAEDFHHVFGGVALGIDLAAVADEGGR